MTPTEHFNKAIKHFINKIQQRRHNDTWCDIICYGLCPFYTIALDIVSKNDTDDQNVLLTTAQNIVNFFNWLNDKFEWTFK
jgi:hypothetical protein